MDDDDSPRKKSNGCIIALAVLAILIAIASAWIIYTPHNRYPAAGLEALRTDKNAVIYSLRPRGPSNEDISGTFHGHGIIGQATLSSAVDRALFADGLAVSTKGVWDAAACFDPHHGFRATGPSGTFDFVLCYGCGRAQVYHPDGHLEEILFHGRPEALNEYLTRHGIALK